MSEVANQIPRTTSDLADFHSFLGDMLKCRDRALSPEEVLQLWRAEHPVTKDFEETVEALREALDDLEAGEVGRPFAEFDAEFRAEHNLPPRQ
jgi:hypothetical protein